MHCFDQVAVAVYKGRTESLQLLLLATFGGIPTCLTIPGNIGLSIFELISCI